MRQLPSYSGATAVEGSMFEKEDQLAPRRRKQIKSGLNSIGATPVINKVIWPHEIVYTSAGKPASYKDISIPQFVHRYMIIMEGDGMAIKERMASHLKELMSDAELYGCEWTRAFDSIWLNKMEHGRCT